MFAACSLKLCGGLARQRRQWPNWGGQAKRTLTKYTEYKTATSQPMRHTQMDLVANPFSRDNGKSDEKMVGVMWGVVL